MEEELDYRIEAAHQRAPFARAFAGDSDVVVPDVLVNSEQVIVSRVA